MDELKLATPFRGKTEPARIGLIGGMSWYSTADYYDRMNRASEARFGVNNNIDMIIDSVRFAPLLDAGRRNAWNEVEAEIVTAGKRLQTAGCGVVAMSAVTAHKCYDALRDALDVPVLHIFDPAAEHLAGLGVSRVGLLGTSYTLSAPFLLDRMTAGSTRSAVRPNAALQKQIDTLIFTRLSNGVVESQDQHLIDSAIDTLRRDGAETTLLACTELPLLFGSDHPAAPDVFDVVALHVDALCNAASRNIVTDTNQ